MNRQICFCMPLRFGGIFVIRCSVTRSCPTLCDPMNCSTPGFPVLNYLLEFAQTHVHLIFCCPFSCPPSFPASGSFPMFGLFTSGSQIIGASTSVLPMNIQDWFPLGLAGLISLLSRGLSRVFSSTAGYFITHWKLTNAPFLVRVW